MTLTEPFLTPEVGAFVDEISEAAITAFRAFRQTGTTTAWGTVGVYERVPGQDVLVLISDPGPLKPDDVPSASVVGLDGTVYRGSSRAGARRYQRIFEVHPEITTVVHVHAPHLGAWSQTHRPLPIDYVPVQRFNLVRELPVYVDRTQPEVEYILEILEKDPDNFAVLEANGGATVWGRRGLLKTAEEIILLEEGARIQILAQLLGGSQPFGPGVLAQQFAMSQLTERAQRKGLLT